MGRLTVLALRGVIAALLAGAVSLQGLMVALLAAGDPDFEGDTEHLLAPVLVIFILGLVTGEVVLACVWRLLTMVRRGTVFSPDAFRYVHIVIGAIVAAALLIFALGFMLAPGEAVAPGIVLLVGVSGVAVLGVALVVVVLRTLLAQAVARDVAATAMEAELEGVI